MNEKFDPCFQEAGISQPNKFFKENKILIRPSVISEFFNYFEDLEEDKQISSLDALLEIIPQISQNATMLVSKSISKQNAKAQDLIDVLIQLAIKLTGRKNQKVIDKLISLIVILAKENNLRKSNLQSVYSILSNNFYDQNLDYSQLCTAVEILQKIFKIQRPRGYSNTTAYSSPILVSSQTQQQQKLVVNNIEADDKDIRSNPYSYFYFQGKDSNVSIVQGNANPVWKFENGICLCFWFYLDQLKYSIEDSCIVPQQKLFTIHTSVDGKGGGIEAYFVNNQLFYRILPEQYLEPTPKSNGVLVDQFQLGEWHFIGIDHEVPKLFGKSGSIKVVVNNKKPISFNMDYPKIPSNSQIKKFCFGEHLIGKISSVMILSQPIGVDQIEQLPKFYQYGFQNSHSLKSLDRTFESSINKIYLLLSPTRSYNNRCYDAINNHVAIFSEKAGVYYKDPIKFKMNELGGLQGIVPLFYIIRFCKKSGETNVVNELLELLIILLHKRHDFQTQAAKLDILKIISNLLSELTEPFIDLITIARLKELKQVMQEPSLLQSFFLDFLWNLDLLFVMESNEVKIQYIAFLKSVYEQNPDHYNKLFSVSQIISQAILKCDVRATQCCQNHSLNLLGIKQADQAKSSIIEAQNSPALNQLSNNNQDQYNQLSKIIQPLFEIIESIFLKSGDDLGQDLIQILNAFNLKCSPCFHLSLFGILKKILIDKPFDYQNNIKKYLKIMIENKAIYTFLYLMQNSPFIDIKAMCLKMINLLNQRTIKQQLINEYELCSYISNILWNLNQCKTVGVTPLINPQESPEKAKIAPQTGNFNLDGNQQIVESKFIEEEDEINKFNSKQEEISQGVINNNNGQQLQYQAKENKKISFNQDQFENGNHLSEIQTLQQNQQEVDQPQPFFKKEKPQTQSRHQKQFQLNKGALNLNIQEDSNSQAINNNAQIAINSENGNCLKEETNQLAQEPLKINKPPQKKKKCLQLDDDILVNTNDDFVRSQPQAQQQEKDSQNNKKTLIGFMDKLNKAQEENQEKEQQQLQNENTSIPQLIPLNGQKKPSISNDFANSYQQESDGFTFNIPNEPYDQMKVAMNPGFNQAPSMLNKRAQGSKFSFPTLGSNPTATSSVNNNGLDLGSKNKIGGSSKFQFDSSGIPSSIPSIPSGGAGTYMEPKMSSKAVQAQQFTFPNQKFKGPISSSNEQSENQSIQQPRKSLKNSNLNLKQIDDKNDEEEELSEKAGESKQDRTSIPLDISLEQNAVLPKFPHSTHSRMKKPNLILNDVPTNDENKADTINPPQRQPPQPNQSTKKGKPSSGQPSYKKKLFGNLEINIDTVNEEYTTGGGENALKQLEIQNYDEVEEEKAIAELARLCVRYMNGELKYSEEDYYNSRMPNIPQKSFNAPMSVRGIKNIDLSQTSQTYLESTEKPLNIILENTAQENEMSFSMDFNKEQSIGPTPKNLQILNKKNSSQKDNFLATDDLIKAQYFKDELMNEEIMKTQLQVDNLIQKDELEAATVNANNQEIFNQTGQINLNQELEDRQKLFDNIDFEPLYISIMEWILQRQPGNLDNTIIITDKDNITSNHALQILMSFYNHCNNNLRPVIIQDLQLVVKWNIQNSNTLLKYTEFYYWLLDILFDQQVNMFLEKEANNNQKDAVSAVLWSSGMKIHAILMKAALMQDPEGYKKLQGIFIWLETKFAQAVSYDQKFTFSVASKYLLRSLWQSMLDAVNEDLKGNLNQQINSPAFWNNIIQAIYSTQEIVLSAHNYEFNLPIVNDHSKIYLSMRNYCTIVDAQNDFNIPKNFKDQITSNNWIDRQIVNGMVKILDKIWNESKFDVNFQKFHNNKQNLTNSLALEESEWLTIQKQVANMLSFSKQEEFLKDFDILMSNSLPERGSFMKICNLLVTLQIDDIIRRRQSKEILKEALERFERMIKYYIVVCENTREKKVLAQKEAIHANILYCLNYLYIQYETAMAGVASNEGNPSEKSEHEKVKNCIGKSIKNIFVFILLCVELIHQQYGNFDNYPQMKANMANFSVSPMIPNLNMILFDLFHTYLLMMNSSNNQQNSGNSANDCILNMKTLKEHKNEYQFLNIGELTFSNEWVFCFTDNPKIWEVINKYYNDIFKNTQRTIREITEESSKGSIRSFKMNEMNKEVIGRTYNNQIFDNTAKVLEIEEQQKYRDLQVNEESVRCARNLWKKCWKRLRIYDGLWKPKHINNQYDQPFDEQRFSYENRQSNPFYYLKIDKYEARNRMKPFLKLKLVDPKYAKEYQIKLKQLRVNQGQTSILSSNVKLTIVQNQISNENINNNSDSVNEIFGKNAQDSFANLQSDTNNTTNIQLSSNNINSTLNINNQGSQNTVNSNNGGNSYFFNLGKNISKNIAKTFKSILPFTKESSSTTQKGINEIQNKNLLISEEVQFTKKCQWIKTLTARNGQLSMTDDNLVFQYESIEQKQSHIAMTSHKIPDDRRLIKEWPLKQIKEVFTRRYILKRTAIEIFFLDGSCVLLNFPHSTQDCEEVSQKLVRNRKKRCPNIIYHNTLDPRKLIEKTNIIQKWLDRQISNFEYLMHLNGLGSRSYKDLTQYPVFPWIITDYKSKDIFTTLRDLTKPMGALGTQERIDFYLERFSNIDPFQDIPPFHYGSHYSSPAIIFQFMLRIQPFTNGTKILQGNKFDIPDRLFCSLEDSFRCATEDNADIRELIPELFYLPELFLNLNKEDFGIRQTGERVDNVEIPQWADRNPFKFVVLHRKALESEAVSSSISNWIDLIFGYKQIGKEAEKNLNVFYHLTYEQKVDLDQIKDESTRISTETQIINFGQTPYQLFLDKPHPQRFSKDQIFAGRIIADPQAEIKVFRPSNGKKKKQAAKEYKIVNFFNDMIDDSIISLKWINDTRFICLRKNGQITQFRWLKNPVHQAQQTAIPFQCGEDKKKEITLDKGKKVALSQLDQSVNYNEYPCYFLKESKIVILGGLWDGIIKLVQIDTNQEVESYQMHNDTVTYMTSDSKENFLITGTKSGEVIVWKINSEMKLSVRYIINDHRDRITQIKISKDLLVFATASEDSTINIYNLISGQFYRTFFHPNNLSIDNVLISYQPLPCIVFYSNQDRTLYSYSINGQFLAKATEEFLQITSSIIIRDNNFSEIIIYGNERGDVYFRELPFLNLRKVYNVSIGSPVLSIVCSKDKRYLLCGCSDGYISVLTDPLTNNRVKELGISNSNNNEQQK
ncbi:hypothetical protein ABPG72_010184 [Tetrahymena utriculariae]